MAFRVVLIENEANIHLKLNNLIVRISGDDIWIPLDDISMIVLDHPASTLTARLLCQLADSGIGVVICDQKHLPIGYYGAYDNHSRASKVMGAQIHRNSSFYDSLWKEIVKKKIENQAKAYFLLYEDNEGADRILAFACDIAEGDRTNREAHAAKVYFNQLMGSSFSRGNEDLLLNSGLDYGYAIIRAYLARLCVGYGLNTQIGIHHKSEYNRFNLVDDILEPVRPFVDIVAYRLLKDEEYFLPAHRHTLVRMLSTKIKYGKKKMFFENMLDEYVAQIASFIQDKTDTIIFPDVMDFIFGEAGDEI